MGVEAVELDGQSVGGYKEDVDFGDDKQGVPLPEALDDVPVDLHCSNFLQGRPYEYHFVKTDNSSNGVLCRAPHDIDNDIVVVYLQLRLVEDLELKEGVLFQVVAAVAEETLGSVDHAVSEAEGGRVHSLDFDVEVGLVNFPWGAHVDLGFLFGHLG